MEIIKYIHNAEGKKTGAILDFENLKENAISNFTAMLENFVYININQLSETKSNKEESLSALEKLQKKDIFKNINDPIQWQKDLRNEWE